MRASSFSSLTPRQQELAYWLTRASIAIDPIIYDQLSAYGLQEKRLLEEIVAHPQGIDPRTQALGDIIVAANGRPVHRLSDLIEEIDKTGIGGTVHLNVMRGDTNTSVRTKIEDMEELER